MYINNCPFTYSCNDHCIVFDSNKEFSIFFMNVLFTLICIFSDKKDGKTVDDEKEKSIEKNGEDAEKNIEEKKQKPKKPVGTRKPSGKALTDITLIDVNITNTKADNLSALHNIIFEDPGKIQLIKKNLRKFNGFDFEADSDDYKRRLEVAEKLDLSKLELITDVLTLSTKGTSKELSERIMTFLMEPKGDKEAKLAAGDENDKEENDNEDDEEAEEEEEVEETESSRKRSSKKPLPRKTGKGGSTGRPRRATAGRSTAKDKFSYVDYTSSEEEAPPKPKGRGKPEDDSGSDVSNFANLSLCMSFAINAIWLIKSKTTFTFIVMNS